jgi:hypothetical protein
MNALSPADEDGHACQLALRQAREELRHIIFRIPLSSAGDLADPFINNAGP